MALAGSSEAQVYYTHAVDENVRTVRRIVDGDFSKLPVITADGSSSIELSFDYLADDQPWLSYSIVHCDADWHQDNLSEMDYLDGFLPVDIDDVSPSFNTFTQYYHYRVTFPNDDVSLTASGNYAVVFHTENEPDDVVAVATFSVSEQKAFVHGSVSANTDIDFQDTHQQLTLDVAWSNSQLPNLNPADDLRLLVQQNNRRDSQRWLTAPSRMQAGRAFYEHNPQLIFEAGNNWYRFEYTDHRYATLGIDHLEYHAPFYYVYLNMVKAAPHASYRYDRDQHGRYLVHALHVSDIDTEAEYFKAMFVLDAPSTLDGRGIYLLGEFTDQVIGESTRMIYDPDGGVFCREVMLKQGSYNYQYVMPEGEQLTTRFIAGNHYETPNEYEIWVYYRPFGARYDRLLGVAKIEDKK